MIEQRVDCALEEIIDRCFLFLLVFAGAEDRPSFYARGFREQLKPAAPFPDLRQFHSNQLYRLMRLRLGRRRHRSWPLAIRLPRPSCDDGPENGPSSDSIQQMAPGRNRQQEQKTNKQETTTQKEGWTKNKNKKKRRRLKTNCVVLPLGIRRV